MIAESAAVDTAQTVEGGAAGKEGAAPRKECEGGAGVPLVLYAEDNWLVAEQVKDVLELAGCRVVRCRDGVEAISMIRTARTRSVRYDLLLLDNDLPSRCGLEIVREARKVKESRRTPIILLALEDCADAAREAGANEFLRKPNNLLTLADTVKRLLDARGRERKDEGGS